MITLNDYITSSGQYKDRTSSSDLTDQVKSNANLLIATVNAFLTELEFKGPIKVSSGFRPASVNTLIKGASKGSLHMSGLAIDIVDVSGDLDEAIKKNPELLDKFGLWLEDPGHTPGWSHLDLGTRSDRPIRIFLP